MQQVGGMQHPVDELLWRSDRHWIIVWLRPWLEDIVDDRAHEAQKLILRGLHILPVRFFQRRKRQVKQFSVDIRIAHKRTPDGVDRLEKKETANKLIVDDMAYITHSSAHLTPLSDPAHLGAPG